MSVHALHFPERPEVLRWTFAGCAILLAHAATATAVVLWYERTPPQEQLIPAIMVSFEPAAPAIVEQGDEPIAEQKVEQIDPTPPEPPKLEEPKIEQPPPEKVAPPPPKRAEIALPRPEPKRVEPKKPPEKRPFQEARDVAATPAVVRQASAAASNSYNSLVIGQLERAKHYPPGAPTGKTSVAFTVSRDGSLLGVHVTKSSGSSILDQAALDVVRHASPFPHFPPEMTQSQTSFAWGLNFASR